MLHHGILLIQQLPNPEVILTYAAFQPDPACFRLCKRDTKKERAGKEELTEKRSKHRQRKKSRQMR